MPQTNTLERRLFYIPSFKIYGSVAGFYDYGPPGCAIKQNLTQVSSGGCEAFDPVAGICNSSGVNSSGSSVGRNSSSSVGMHSDAGLLLYKMRQLRGCSAHHTPDNGQQMRALHITCLPFCSTSISVLCRALL
jgi:hypothetical protein